MRRQSMQVAVEAILTAHGKLAEFQERTCFYLRLEKGPGWDPLVIERHGSRVCVAHYFTQYGDQMADPELEFEIDPDGLWYTVALTQAPMGVYRSKFIKRGDKTYVDIRFDREVRPLAQAWARNLRHQGWDKALVTS